MRFTARTADLKIMLVLVLSVGCGHRFAPKGSLLRKFGGFKASSPENRVTIQSLESILKSARQMPTRHCLVTITSYHL